MTPKAQYLAAYGKRHRELFRNEEAERGLIACFTQFCWDLPQGGDGASALIANSKRQGVREFIDLVLGFTEAPEPRKLPGSTSALEPEGTSWSTHTPIPPKH